MNVGGIGVDRIRAIGGYFELELGVGRELHEEAISFNSARNCFRYILETRKPSKIYLPTISATAWSMLQRTLV